MIQLKSVSKVYRVGPVKVTALDGVSLEIEKGEFTVLAGPSGPGKTTLLRLLHRDEGPEGGRFWTPCATSGPAGRRSCGRPTGQRSRTSSSAAPSCSTAAGS